MEKVSMLTESEIILARYRQVEKEADVLGRVIGVRRLKPSETTKVASMTADVTGSDDVIGENGEKTAVQHRLPLMIAAAVCMIGETHIPFARNRAELDAIYDRLDSEGLSAAARALARLQAQVVIASPLDAAKNW